MVYKFQYPSIPERWADASGLKFRSYSVYSGGASDSPDPSSLVSGVISETEGVSTQISTFAVPDTKTYVWRGYFKPDATSTTWQFRVTSEDGAYLWLDTNAESAVASLNRSNAIIDNGGTHGSQTTTSANQSLDSDFHYAIVLIAGSTGGAGSVTLEWRRDAGSWQSVGTGFLEYDSRYPDGFGADTYATPFSEIWVAVGDNSKVATSTNADQWSTYPLSDSTDGPLRSVAYGKDTSTGATMWMIGTNNSYATSGSSPVSGAAGWSPLEHIINKNGHRALQFGDNGDGVWVMASRARIKRNASGSWSGNIDLNVNMTKGVANNGSGTWAIATTVYNQGRPAIWKSLDDGATWSAAWVWPTNYGINYAVPKDFNIAYKSNQWVAVFPEAGIFTGSIGAGAQDNNSFGRVLESSENISYIAAGSANTWMALDKARNVYVSTNNAASFSTATAIPGSDSPTGIAYYGGTWIVTTDGTTNNIVKSVDNGSSWTTVASTGEPMYAVAVNSILP